MKNNFFEDEKTELKKSTSELKEAIISIVSILNKHQKGILYFGIKNDGTVLGQQIGKDTLRNISRTITDSIEPKIYPIIEEIELEGKSCIKVEFEGNDIPYFANGRTYIRVSDEDKQLSQRELRNLILKANKADSQWENQVTKYNYEDIKEELLKSCIKQGNESQRINYKYTNKHDILNRLGLINEEGYLLNAGNALFGKNANIVLKMAVFATETKNTFIDISRKTGNIIELSKIGEAYVKEHIKWTVNLKTGRIERLEIPEIPVDSIREAIMNCLCHQSMVTNQEAEISIFKDRIEIYNPGTFPEEYTPQDFIKGTGKSILRNKIIAQTLFLSHEIEAFGTGIRRIYEECQKNNVKVDFRQDKLGFTVIFYRKSDEELEQIANVPLNVLLNVPLNVPLNLSEKEKKILEIIEKKHNITQNELAKKLQTTDKTIKRYMDKLKESRIIERVGSKKAGYWKINKENFSSK